MTTDIAWTKNGGYKETWQQTWHEQRTGVIKRLDNRHGMGLNKELGLYRDMTTDMAWAWTKNWGYKETWQDMAWAWTKNWGYKEAWKQTWHGHEKRMGLYRDMTTYMAWAWTKNGVIQRHNNRHDMGLNKELGL